MTNSPDDNTAQPRLSTFSKRTYNALGDIAAMQASPDVPDYYRRRPLANIRSLLEDYQELLNIPLFPLSDSLTAEQVERNKSLHQLVKDIRHAQSSADERTWQLYEQAVNRIISLQLAQTATINAAAAKEKRTTWINGPDDSKISPEARAQLEKMDDRDFKRPTIDDVEPQGRLITSPGPLYNPMPLGVDTKIGSQHTNWWYSRLKETQRDNIAKLRAEGAPDEMIRQAMPRWMIAEEKAVELNEEYFNAYPHLRPKATRQLTEEELEDELALGSAPLQTAAVIHAAAGDYQKAQFSMLRALFAQQAESEERLSKRLDRPKFNTHRATKTEMEQ